MHKLWKWNLHGHLSMLPITVIYAAWCFVVYGARSWGFRNGVIVCIGGTRGDGSTRILGKPGAQTIGACQAYADTAELAREDLHVHENTHIVEQMVVALIGAVVTPAVFALLGWSPIVGTVLGGPFGALLYTAIYVAVFLRWYLTDQGKDERPGWHDDYLRNVLERWAYAAQARFIEMTDAERRSVWS